MRRLAALFIILFLAGCAASQKEADFSADFSAGNGKADPVKEAANREKAKTLSAEGLRLISIDPEGALKAYSELMTLTPYRWEVHYNTGIIYLKMNAPDKAEKALLTALKFKAPYNKAYSALGSTYLALGKIPEALEAFKKALAAENSVTGLINVANVLQSMSQLEEALKYYRQAEGIEPANPKLRHNISLLFYRLGDYKKAMEEINKIPAVSADNDVMLYKANVHMKLGEYDAALKIFQNLKEKFPSEAVYDRNIGILYEIYYGDMEKALDSYNAYLNKIGKSDKDVEAWISVVKAKIGPKEEKK